ncbi:hypothetical protein WJX73_004363 [Symbiochloris irregularis]|uniref:Uncharacterized protein n=1 Tax=Symbiochloris irregularis TaxID=706552 RepID=A0AAW1NU61_9CHLO
MNPNSLQRSFRSRKRTGISVARTLTVEGDIQPVLNYLASLGLTKRQIIKVISAHPPVLCYSPEQRLKPFFDILRNAGIPDPVKTMVQRPSMLGIEPDQGLRRIIGYLRESGQSPDAIAELLATSI